MTYFDETILREELNIPENLEIVNLLVLGYRDETEIPSAKRYDEQRLPLHDTVFYESYK